MSKSIVGPTHHVVGDILYLSFNQDLSRLCCGTDIGFMVFDTNPMKIQFQKIFNAGIAIVEVMHKSNILALVGGGSNPYKPPNKCIIWDDKDSAIVTELEYRECVRGVKITKDYLVVATDDLVRVYDLKDKLNMLYKIKTGINIAGLMELSIKDDTPLLITPHPKDVGKLILSNYMKQDKKEVGQLQCCKHPIKAIRLNNDATKFAVVSELGTLIRIYDVSTQSLQTELRRGTEQANIQTVYFSDDSNFLMVASDKGTIHVYSITEDYANTKSSLNMISGILPTYFKSIWSMNKITLSNNRFVAGIVRRKNTEEQIYDISVFMYDGKYHHYEFKPKVNTIELKTESDFIVTEQ